MYYEKHRSTTSDRYKRVKIAAMVMAIIIVGLTINAQFRSVLSNAAQARAENAFSSKVSDALIEVIDDGFSFDVVTLQYDYSGRIVSIQSDTQRVNQLKAQITQALISSLDKSANIPLNLSLGTLSGFEMLAGRGPEIEFNLELRGGITTEIKSDFFDSGINQTLHRISCVVSADYFIIMPGHRFAVTLSTIVPIAESVIVGDVPDAYTYVVGDQSDTISRIFDYGAE